MGPFKSTALSGVAAGGRKIGRRGSATRSAAALAEPLEARRLLTAAPNSSALLAAVPAGDTAQLTSAGLLLSASSASARVITPAYELLDANPQLNAAGMLAPFGYTGPVGLSPTQLRNAYAINAIVLGGVTGTGAGQTIAIVDAYNDPNIVTDLATFDAAYNLAAPPSFSVVNETGGSALPVNAVASTSGSWALEEALDVEWTHAVAPAANILLVEASSNNDYDLVEQAVSYARTVPGVSAVSMSWGEPEWNGEASEDSYFTTPAGHAGVTFLAATGDDAAPGTYPAYSPNVVAVGGTQLNTDGAGDYLGETGWSGSGGGISGYETQPAYQNGVVTQSSSYRTTPDVSFDASPASGVAVCDSYDFGASGPWIQVGGTSLATPCWAGLIAITNQLRPANSGSLDGPSQTLPDLYQLNASALHDITSGSNGFSAGPGYDLVTGRGSPIANLLVSGLDDTAPYVVSASPTGTQNTLPGSISFVFNQAMNPASFSVGADVDAFTGPGSVDERSTITGYTWLSSTTLQVDFSLPGAVGNYTMTIGPQILSAAGAAMDQDRDGVPGESTDTYTQSFTYNSTLTPSAPVLVASSDSGVSSSDGITNYNNSAGKPLSFTVAGVTFGDTVQLLSGTAVVGSAVANASSVIVSMASGTVLADGAYSFTAEQTPPGGPTSVASAATAITIDTAAPATPGAPLLQAASDTGISSTDGITNDLTPTFTVTVSTPYFRFYRSTTLISATYQSGSTFTLPTQSNGTFIYDVVAVDAAGNTSPAGATKSVTFDTTPPAVPAAPVLTAASDTGTSSTDDITNSTSPVFDVTATEPGLVGVDIDGAPTASASASGAGVYPVGSGTVAPRGFASAASYAAGSGPWAVIAADMNGDGKADLVVTDTSTPGVSVLLNQGNGSFSSPITTSLAGYFPNDVAAADFNGDGKMDLVITTVSNNVLLLLGNGNGTFQTPRVITTGVYTRYLAVGDFNGDGKTDFAVTASGENSVSVFLGNGDGTFQPRKITYVNGAAYGIAAGDFNGDGKTDLAVVDGSNVNQIQVLLGNGDGTFTTASTITGLINPVNLAVGDFNNDGKLDLVAADNGSNAIALMLGNGNGTFASPTFASAGYNLNGLVVGDFNGDGNLDAATTWSNGTIGPNDVSVCYGNGAGGLAAAVYLPIGLNPIGLASADLNGDGKPDIISANYYSDTVSVLLGEGGPLSPGVHTITAWAEDVAGNISATSAPLSITVDTTAPTAALAATPAFAGGYVDTASLTFSEPIAGLTKANLLLTNGNSNLLDGTETLSTTDNQHWTLTGLGPLNLASGGYTLTVSPTGITDIAGNALASAVSTNWTVTDSQPPAIVGLANDSSFYVRSDSTGRYLQVWKNTTPTLSPTPTYSYAASAAGPLVIDAGNASTTFTWDCTAGSIASNALVTFNGVTAGQNTLTILLPAAGGTMELDTGNHLLLDSVTGATDSNLSAITIDGAAGNDTVTLNAADAPPIAFLPGSGADVLNLDSGTYTLTAADADAPNLTINDYSLLQVAAAGATTFAPTIGALNLDSSASYGTGNAVLLPSDSGAQTVLTVGSISMQSPTAQSLNLNDNNLIVQNSSFATISADVMQSYAGGTWLGAGGIGSAAAATDATHLHTLGMVWNDDGAGHAIYSSFDGQPVGVDAILIRYTLWGDANLDGVVNTADYLLIDNGFALHLTGWRNGDFNYGAVVDGDDYSLIDNAFNEQNAASFAAAASPAATSSPAAVTANAANEVAASGSGAADQSAPVGSTSFNAAIAVRPNDPPAAPVNWGETNTADLSLAGLLDQWTIGDNE